MFSLAFVCLCISLSVNDITQKVMNGFVMKFVEGSRVVKRTSGWSPDHHADCPIRNPVVKQHIMTEF